MSTEVIAVFDIGKTNKKILLFNKELNLEYVEERKFPEIKDDDGFECDDIDAIEEWLFTTFNKLLSNEKYDIKGLNFSTYGASFAYIDADGNRLTPVYNYLKTMPEGLVEPVYEAFGGIEEFSRNTASPALGFLNSGLQLLWLKKQKPEIYAKTKHFVHFPQYLSYLFTGEATSEYTSIGCHTALWDFDNMKYHPWLGAEGIQLPEPISNSKTFNSEKINANIPVGIGIHDSSSSIVPYLIDYEDKFILLSTGTWCISMNPFNEEPLTKEQLEQDCLSFLSINQKPVKSSRLFMGHIHDVNTKKLTDFFNVPENSYKKVATNRELIKKIKTNGIKFFADGVPEDYIENKIELSQFNSFEEAYHQLMLDLSELCINAISLIIPKTDDIKKIYISGGFAKNEIFTTYIATNYPDKKVYTSELDNATALGAAMVIYDTFGEGSKPSLDLGFNECTPLD